MRARCGRTGGRGGRARMGRRARRAGAGSAGRGWRAGDGGAEVSYSLVPAARDVVPRFPGGLGRSATGVAGSSALPQVLAEVDADERRVLDALAAGPPIGRSRAADPSGPVARLLAKGLLLRVDQETVELPRQVGLALRGDRPLGALALHPPPLDVRDRDADTVDRTAGGAALELLRRVEALITFWGATPPPLLRSGGVGVRDLRRAAREIDTDEATAAFLIELAAGADLVAPSEGVTPDWLPDDAGRRVARRWPGDRAGRSWPEPGWSYPAAGPRRAQGRRGQADQRPVRRRAPPARPARPAPRARRPRRAPARPRRGHARAARRRPGVAGAPSRRAAARRGRHLDARRGDDARGGRAGRPQRPGAGTARRRPTGSSPRCAPPCPRRSTTCCCRPTSPRSRPARSRPGWRASSTWPPTSSPRASATVYRFSEPSIRRALDAGRSAADLHHLFATRSATPVPQGLTYLVDDVARRHGRLRGGAAAAFLRSDDEVLLAEVLAHPDAPAWELRRIAPTVLVSAISLVELMDGAAHGRVQPGRRGRRRRGAGPLRPRPSHRAAPPRHPHRAPGVGRRPGGRAWSRACAPGETIAGLRRGAEAFANGSTVDLLRSAVVERRTVWIGFVDRHGVRGERVLAPVSVGGGVVEGRANDGAVLRLPLSHITSIALVDGMSSAGARRHAVVHGVLDQRDQRLLGGLPVPGVAADDRDASSIDIASRTSSMRWDSTPSKQLMPTT